MVVIVTNKMALFTHGVIGVKWAQRPAEQDKSASGRVGPTSQAEMTLGKDKPRVVADTNQTNTSRPGPT